MNEQGLLPGCLIVSILIMDVNDLIRGHWFYHSTLSIIIWNLFLLLCVLHLVLIAKEGLK